jgi:hypothetical protein
LARLAVAAVVGVAAGAVVGFFLGDWPESVGGGAGGLAGAVGVGGIVGGALRTGGTRGGTAALMGIGALGVAALALLPGVGYLEAVVLPALGLRLRRRAPKRYAGLRTLADR